MPKVYDCPCNTCARISSCCYYHGTIKPIADAVDAHPKSLTDPFMRSVVNTLDNFWCDHYFKYVKREDLE